jgi:flagellar biogenesis protein FliO
MIPNLKNKFHSSIGSSIAIEETASFTGGQLLVVKARGRTFLLGSTAQNLTCLSELTEAPESQEPAFFELVDKAEGKTPEFAVVETAIPEREAAPKPDIADQLSRLKRLIG